MDMDSEKDKLLDEIEAEVTVQYTQKDYYQVIDLLIYLLLPQPTNPGDRLVR